MSSRRRASEHRDTGMVLPLVLVFTVIAGVVVATVVTLAITSLRSTTELQQLRDEEYAAAAAIDLQIEYLRNDDYLATATGVCPGFTSTVNDTVVTVTCSNPGTAFLGRDIELSAWVDGDIVLSAGVHIDIGIDPTVNVNEWSYD